MNLKDKISSLEQVLMINPFTKKSHRAVRNIAQGYNFYADNIYPEEKIDAAKFLPKVLFVPDKSVIKTIILATLKWG